MAPGAGEKPFLSASTSNFHPDLKSALPLKCLRTLKKKRKRKASGISANINLVQTKIE